MTDHDGSKIVDQSRWGELVETYFQGLWKCCDPTERSVINDWLASQSHRGIDLRHLDVQAAL